ncbi:hypothetical protein [Haloplasma contractile]|uniref:Uncharacterized protein n=1 Tax=Haloplasma contractile SSD-17B TaxID=1033810 RepID=U2FI73_9MOLU|nr:hypothetical protein [Haloplasma contractile]ERJ10919.1 hypothetical protein HLPCO_003083 [Haloplasma contractile SSD-17B]
MRINFGLFIRHGIKLLVTLFVVQVLSVGVYQLHNYFFDDYVSEAKIVSSCFDSANSCKLIGDASSNKNLSDYVTDTEIIESVVKNIETSTGEYLSVTDVRDSITVESKEGYLLLKIKSSNSYLANIIYDNLITEVFEEANEDQIRYTVVDYSLHEYLPLSNVRQIGILIGTVIAFYMIFSTTKEVTASEFKLLGGITLAKNKMKQNIVITFITIALFIIVGTGIYFGHKTLFKSYQIETKYTFVCNNPDTCEFDDINELYNALKSNTSKNSTVTSIIDSVSTTSQIHLSTEDIENSFELKLNNDVIVLVVTNEDTLTATYINDTITNKIFSNVETREDIKLRQLDSDFSETPNFSSYLIGSTTVGSMTALLLISSELKTKKKKAPMKKTSEK